MARIPRLGGVLACAGLAVLPWTVVLAVTLPSTAMAAHWPGAWVGLDTMEGFGLITTGVLFARDDHRCPLPAAVTATLLAVDAWFDTMTAATWADLAGAAAMALLAELPLAALCALIAWGGLPVAASAEPLNH